MTERYFPDLPERALTALSTIRAQLAEDPGYLGDPACPYSPEERDLLKHLLVLRLPSVELDDEESRSEADMDLEVDDLEILDSVGSLYRQLKTFGKDVEGRTDTKDRAAYFRVAVALTDKIITLRERAERLKDWGAFKTRLMAWLESVDPDLRTEFMDQIKDWNVQ